MSDASLRALREVLVPIREASAKMQDPDFDAEGRSAMRSAWFATRSDTFDNGLAALDSAVTWNRAGRVYFGLTPACGRAIVNTLERTRPMWDGLSRDARHLRWFVGRLTKPRRSRS